MPLSRTLSASFAQMYSHSYEVLQPALSQPPTPTTCPTPLLPIIVPSQSHQGVLCGRLADIGSHPSASHHVPHSFDAQQQQEKQQQQQLVPELSGAALMAEALGRLCHAASSTAKRSRSGSPRGSTHTGAATAPHPAAANFAKASQSGSLGSSSSSHSGIATGPHHAASSTAKASRSGSPGSSSSSTHTGIATGPHHAASSTAKAAGPGPPGHEIPCSNTGTASDARSHAAAAPAPVKDTHTAEVSASSSQSAQAGVPVAAVGNAAQLSAEFTSDQRSQTALAGLHADSATEDEQLRCKDEGRELRSSAESDKLQSSIEEERLQGSTEDERLQGRTEKERLQSSTEEERLQGSAEGEQTPRSATGVGGRAVGGTAGILAALQELDAQPDGPQLPTDTQAVSGIPSGPASTQEVSSTQPQSSSGSWGLSEDGQPSVHSSTQEPADATAVATEAEEQAEPDRGEASGSLSAASAGDAAGPPLLMMQVSGLGAMPRCSSQFLS